jgi:hypothetical protein
MWNTVGMSMLDKYNTPKITIFIMFSTVLEQVVPVLVSGVSDGEVRCAEKRDAAR